MTDDDDSIKIRTYIGVATFLVGFLSASAPIKVIDIDAHLFSVGNLLASGVLLSAGIVHQLPDAIEKFESSYLDGDFPIAPFIAGLTFCLFLILEEYIHTHFDNNPLVLAHEGFELEHHDHHHHENDEHKHRDEHKHKHKHNEHAREDEPLLRLSSTISAISGRRRKRSGSDLSWASQLSCTIEHESARGGTHRHDLEHVAEHIHGSLLASVILLLALSIHSIFDGLAIGISSNAKELISTTAAVLAHKGFAGYALGSSMVASEMHERDFFALILVFSVCTPVGIILGTIFSRLGDSDDPDGWKIVGTGLINAVVAGTFLYIAIVEIGLKEILVHRDSKLLGHKLDTQHMQWSKLAAFIIGYLAMSSLAVFI
eukprot:CAMPEP_0116137854 /NCGR_PEP_ID=MMETSP0329-20121206/12463_1 /TAXON_ID=697910 /ORGANISM="Pseudo-nitzschia arenysensis, Strain B593" /LENGTH=371 /DNA_ID=CAMNT_0003632783 /DNA_START=35 /DNA_END=1150 /DNA_ORIENTATION=+